MASISKITLLGRLGKDATLSSSNGGTQYAKFSIATEEYTGKQDGKAVYTTEWWECTVFGQQAEYVGNNAKKGMDIFVEGQLKLTVKGEKVYRDVNVAVLRLISRPAGSSSQSEETTTASAPATTTNTAPRAAATTHRSAPPAAAAPETSAVAVAEIADDDLPF